MPSRKGGLGEWRAMTEREVGKVKWFSQVKRYGFIQRRNGKPDVFVHFNEFRSRQDAYWVKDGDSVEFVVELTDKGPQAVDVQVL
jgi:CspA family cold shock protein